MEYWSLLYGVHNLFFTLLPWWNLNRVSNPMYVSSLNIRYTPNKIHATIYRKFPGCRYVRQGQHQWLTHWGRDKIAAIFQTTFLKWIFMDEGVWISIEMSLTFIPKGPVNNIPALVQIMAWRRPSDNHCLNECCLVYRRIYASLGLNEFSQLLVVWFWLEMVLPLCPHITGDLNLSLGT